MCRLAVLRRLAGLVAVMMFGAIYVASVEAQTSPGGHYRHASQTPPGRVGQQRLVEGGPVVGYLQPVAISAPQDITISVSRDGGWTEPTVDTVLAGMSLGQPYRLKLSNLPLHPEGDCYPTIEIIDRTYPPPGLELKFPIPVVLNDDDIRRAMDGMLVTRVIYVEDPQQAIPGAQRPGEQLWHDIGPTANPLQEAERLGRPVAIVRLGGRVPDESQGPDFQFVFGSPHWHYFANTPDERPSEPAANPTSNVEVIGEAPAKPIVGKPLPTLARECYEGGIAAPPLPHLALGTFVPPGIKGPWPPDEYLHDGGDALEPVGVSPEWRVQGLNVEDTVAHYDTMDGRTLVERTNCEYVYSPRFSSVRTVLLVVSNEFVSGPNNYVKPIRAGRFEERALVRTNVEQLQPIGQAVALRPGVYHRDQRDGVLSYNLLPSNAQLTLRPYENLSVIRTGAMQSADKARLAESVDAAIAWTKDEGVLVFIDKLKAIEHIGDRRAQVLFTVKEPTYGRLRICKIASTPAALPGEFVEFTLRYDNAGDQVLGNIVILDSLTSRLEFVDGTATSSRKARFSVIPNEAESLQLRWEIEDSLQPGDGGIVRFRCRVR